jgi:predicted nucleic acid-binding protein
LIVLDASAAICVLLNSPGQTAANLRHRLQDERLHAPHLIDLEVTQTLRRLVLSGGLTVQRADDALNDLAQFPIARYPHHPFIARIWQLRSNVTAYDAAYIALAESLNTPLLTLDARLARASPGLAVEVF